MSRDHHGGQSSLENIMDNVVAIHGGEVNLKNNVAGKHYNDSSRQQSVKRNATSDNNNKTDSSIRHIKGGQ